MSKKVFEDQIEEVVLEDAKEWYYGAKQPVESSRWWLEAIANQHNRDLEEAQLMHMVLFPYAVEYISKYVVEDEDHVYMENFDGSFIHGPNSNISH